MQKMFFLYASYPTLRHLARPRPALRADVKKVMPLPASRWVSGWYVPSQTTLETTRTAMRNVMMIVVGTASVKISFSITFLSRCFFFFKAFLGCFQKR